MRATATARLLSIALIAATVIILYRSSFMSMWDLWLTRDHRHGMFVFPISAYLIWMQRHRLDDIPAQADFRGLLLILPVALVWVASRLVGVQVIEHFAVLAMIPAATVAFMGAGTARQIRFPLLFLMFATPFGDFLVPYLMELTADISTFALRLGGVPLLRSGQYLSLPGGDFVVADVCSGIMYLVTGVMVALLYGYLTYTGPVKRLSLLIVTVLLVIAANSARAVIVMAVASATEMKYFGGRDHIYFGWLLFGIVMVAIMWVGARFADEIDTNENEGVSSVGAVASHTGLPMIAALALITLAITIKPLQRDIGESTVVLITALALFMFIAVMARNSGTRSGLDTPVRVVIHPHGGWSNVSGFVLQVAILALVPWIDSGIRAGAGGEVPESDPRNVIPCNATTEWAEWWRPVYQSPDVEFATTFECPAYEVSVYSAAYASAMQGRELIQFGNYPVPPQVVGSGLAPGFRATDGHSLDDTVVEVVVGETGSEMLVWYWYDVNGRFSTSSLETKILQTLALVQRKPSGGRVVVVGARILGELDDAREQIARVTQLLKDAAAEEGEFR